jgi:hypothetical protein
MALFAAFALSAALASPITPNAATDLTPEQRVVAGTSSVSTLRASDPQRGHLAWTLRISRSETGLQCSTVGQLQDTTFGLVGLDGAFRALPEANTDACGEPGTPIGARVFAAKRTRDVRSVLYGVAGAGVAKVTVTVAGGKPRTVPHTADGAFLLALRGYPEDAQPVVTIRRAGGATSTYNPVGGRSTIVADPFGGRAWKLQAFAFGTPAKPKASLRTSCVSFATARAVPDEANVSATPVCGLEPARPGVKRKPLYFATRRLSGTGPSTNFLAGNWAGHPARVAVWGIARGAKHITVRAGSFSKSTAPLINGGFLVFLPASTRPGVVRVTVDGKRYGSTFGTVAPPKPARASAAVASAATVPVDATAPGRLPDGRYRPGWVQYRTHGTKFAATFDDPAGGLPWVLRQFDAERVVVDKPVRTLAGAKVIGRSRCVQLGRLRGATFGWIFGDGQFRKAGIEYPLLQCTALKRQRSVGQLVSILAPGDPSAPVVAASVAWGYLPGASEATITGSGAADGAAKVTAGAFLRVGGPGASRDAASVSGGGRKVSFGPRGLPSAITKRITFPTLIAGTETTEAPAPDPAGGPHWGMSVAQTVEGVPCSGGPARVVGDQGGGVDLRLGLFTEVSLIGQSCRPLQTKPSAARPCDIGSGFGSAEELEGVDGFLEQARVQRRLLAGRTSMYAQCSADVERVTLRTPRDVRTLVPSAAGHTVLAVYDGEFVGGQMEFIAHLRGGKVWRQRQSLGF